MKILFGTSLALFFTLIISGFKNDVVTFNGKKGYWHQHVIYGETVATPELHNVYGYNDECGNTKWCGKDTELTVETPNALWRFTGKPYLELVQDNDKSWSWNKLGPNTIRITLDNPTIKKAVVRTGSRSIKVRIACMAEYFVAK